MSEMSHGSEGSALASLEQAFERHRGFLWGLSYRMTGSAADADDVVQETFARAIERPPRDTTAAWRPWLTRVALNLNRDTLRRRRRRSYVGPWLPAPIETTDTAVPAYEPAFEDGRSTEGRYDLLESVSYAFLVAIEALTPKQRGVLLLRDVFDYSVAEAAEALGLSDMNVKTTHHRARQAMSNYDESRCRPTREYRERVQSAVARLMAGLASGDQKAIEAVLAPDAVAVSDGAGEFHAARKLIVGRSRVATFYRKIFARRAQCVEAELREINGALGVVGIFHDQHPHEPPRFVGAFDVDEQGLLTRLYTVVATGKLQAIAFPS